MAVLQWGKPKIEICKLDETTGKLPTSPIWKPIPIPKEGTTKMNTEKGTKKEAIEEGGGVVDSKIGSNKYSLEFELYAKKGETKPIEDFDGKITGNYAIRWLGEDETTGGYKMLNTSVSVEDSYDADMGGIWKYTFQGLKPKVTKAQLGTPASRIVQEYTV